MTKSAIITRDSHKALYVWFGMFSEESTTLTGRVIYFLVFFLLLGLISVHYLESIRPNAGYYIRYGVRCNALSWFFVRENSVLITFSRRAFIYNFLIVCEHSRSSSRNIRNLMQSHREWKIIRRILNKAGIKLCAHIIAM